MSPKQHYFPYFFHHDDFNKELKRFGLTSYLIYDDKIKMPNQLVIVKKRFFLSPQSQQPLFTLPFGKTMMVVKNELLYWDTKDHALNLYKIDLSQLINNATVSQQAINISGLNYGQNTVKLGWQITDFATFMRKEDLKYDLDYYENFVIITIDNNDLKIIPFDWFNKTGGDYGYVWPATARFDEYGKLHGQGMRMASFVIDLNDTGKKPY